MDGPEPKPSIIIKALWVASGGNLNELIFSFVRLIDKGQH